MHVLLHIMILEGSCNIFENKDIEQWVLSCLESIVSLAWLLSRNTAKTGFLRMWHRYTDPYREYMGFL